MYIESRGVNDVKINHGSLQSDRMSGDIMMPLTLLRSKQKKKYVIMLYCTSFSTYIRFFKALIKTNVNTSNELNFSDVCRSVNYI